MGVYPTAARERRIESFSYWIVLRDLYRTFPQEIAPIFLLPGEKQDKCDYGGYQRLSIGFKLVFLSKIASG